MTEKQKQIYALVHDWCDNQAANIPDANRRALMDSILDAIEPDKTKELEEAIALLKKCKIIYFIRVDNDEKPKTPFFQILSLWDEVTKFIYENEKNK